MTDRKSLVAPIIAIVAMVVLFAVSLFLVSFNRPQSAQGSVNYGNDYHSTSTPNGTGAIMNISATSTDEVGTPIKIPGTLGSVIVTGTSTGAFTFYDATTTDITKRTGGTATSSITLASFPAGEIPGTYIFDLQFYNGLQVVFSGNIGSTTITYRLSR